MSGRPAYIPCMEDFKMFCSPSGRRWVKQIGLSNTFQVLYKLLNGEMVDYECSQYKYMVAMSALPRRIKDLRDHAHAIIEPSANEPLTVVTRPDGSTYRKRVYYMKKENIETFMQDRMGLKANWPVKEPVKKLLPKILTAC